MDSSRFEYVKNIFNDFVKEGKAAGASAAVYKDGKEMFFHAVGDADIERQYPMSKDTIFRCFSMTKPVTAVAALILMERGIIDLCDPVSKYIPEFAVENMKVLDKDGLKPCKTTMQLHHLLNMTSGLPYPDPSFPAGEEMIKLFEENIKKQDEGNAPDTLEWCRQIARQPLKFEPGEKWMYGTSADVLAGVIEVASGMRYSEFLKKEIFEPLGMKDTDFFVPDDKKHRFAQIYDVIQGKGCTIASDRNLGMEGYAVAPAFESGGAGLVSTIEDYSRFARMLANGGTFEGVKILSQHTMEFMSTNQLTAEQRKYLDWDTLQGYGYGNLCRTLIDPSSSRVNANIGCFGWDGWTGNYFLTDPVENVVIIYVIQKTNGTDGTQIRKFINTVYAAI